MPDAYGHLEPFAGIVRAHRVSLRSVAAPVTLVDSSPPSAGIRVSVRRQEK